MLGFLLGRRDRPEAVVVAALVIPVGSSEGHRFHVVEAGERAAERTVGADRLGLLLRSRPPHLGRCHGVEVPVQLATGTAAVLTPKIVVLTCPTRQDETCSPCPRSQAKPASSL